MDQLVAAYPGTVLAWVLLALLLLVQVLVADVTAIRRRQTPGMSGEEGHGDFLWRSERAYRNTNETLGAFILLSLAVMAVGSHPVPANGLALGFAAARGGHMLCYWLDLRLARSICWALAVVILFAMALLAAVSW